jgi:hypothetical protein
VTQLANWEKLRGIKRGYRPRSFFARQVFIYRWRLVFFGTFISRWDSSVLAS